MVNLHHFIMDGAIWKLRDGRVGQVLLRDGRTGHEEAFRPSRPWLRQIVYLACVGSVIVPAVSLYETSIGIPSARQSKRIDAAFDRLRLVGRESIGLHNYTGREYASLGRFEAALRHFERSVELHPTPDGLTGVGHMQRQLGRYDEAGRAYDAALALDADFIGALVGNAHVIAIDSPSPQAADLERARALVDHALGLQPELAEALQLQGSIAEVEARL